ncbi:phage major capsid protein [Streptomyces sp. NBC_01589]|uniref:phage major capsid protein n=1 Tax=Streptomyces sp. NBC_01589 TaxID=2975886 RepID=UPI00386B59D5
MSMPDIFVKQAKAALEKRANLVSELRSVEADPKLSASEKRERVERIDVDLRALEAEAREAVERGEREAEVRSLTQGVPGFLTPGTAEQKRMLPSLGEYRQLTTASADAVIPTQLLGNVFDFLRAKSVFLSANPQLVTMDSMTLEVPRIAASSTASMTAEGAGIGISDTTFQAVTLTAKKAAVLTKATNESLMDSSPELQQLVAKDHMKEVARLLDAQFLAGNGTTPNMRGLRNFSGVNVTPLGTNGASLSLDGLADAVGRLEQNNGDLNGAAWFMSGRSWASIRKAKDGQQRYQVSPDPTRDGERRLFGIPVFVSNQISNAETVGTSSDCSWIGLADMGQVVVGRRQEVRVIYSSDAYFDSDSMGVRTTSRWDIAPLDPKGIELITGVRP